MPGPVSSAYTLVNAVGPFIPAQVNGGASANNLAITGAGATFSNSRLNLPVGTYLNAGALGINLPTNADLSKTQTPASLALEWIGIVPASEVPLCSLHHYAQGRFELTGHWQAGKVRVFVERGGTSVLLDSISGISNSVEETVGVRYDDDAVGVGGTITFLRNGVAFGPAQPINFKLRITPQCELQSNATIGNTSNSAALSVRKITLNLTDVAGGGGGGGSTSFTVYGDPTTRFPLGLDLTGASGNHNLTVPVGLNVVKRVNTPTPQTNGSVYTFNALATSYPAAQTNGGVTANALAVTGSGAAYTGGVLKLPVGTYLSAGAIGINLPTSTDVTKTRTPRVLTMQYQGIIPQNTTPLASLYEYNQGQFSLYGYWQAGQVAVYIERDGQTAILYSQAGLSNTVSENIAVKYTDNLTGSGGTVTFLRNGVAFGPPQALSFKPKITPGALFESNATLGNTSNSAAMSIKSVSLTLEVLANVVSYPAVASGVVTIADLAELFIDALPVSTAQPGKIVAYTPVGGGTTTNVNVIIGPIDVPVGVAYRAILENWSTGSAVSSPNVLIMIKPARQNCQFEDATLRVGQSRWMECLPQGAVPVVNNIAYYCEAIRIGTYVQFQFGYDWTAAAMPNNPFGDPTGKESYMVPHKWRIEDKNGTVLGTVQRPDGGPLNGTDVPGIFSGTFDGSGVAITNAANKWYPQGTVRSGVIWRSAVPAAYDQAFINANLPRYDATIPYAQHTNYSNNGFDGRLWGGDSSNGFGNTRVIPYEPTNYATLTTQAGVTLDPWKGTLYSQASLAAVASTWLRYTPFNQSGRSPITGPGGSRDDRCAIAEPIALYMYNSAATRPHDNRPWGTIALDYLTAYVSDPYHAFENGRCVPLFKGLNAARTIKMRNFFYGPGDQAWPANQSWFIQGGRQYEMADSYNPWTAKVPSKGTAIRKPTFGTNQIDILHAHQFPHWGSLLWKTPEFAFLGHRFSDQARIYERSILASSEGYAGAIGERSAAWQFLHSVMMWKTASSNSDRLYSRSEVLKFVVDDFEAFSDTFKTSNPGFDNPPANIVVSGSVDKNRALFAATQKFGPCIWFDDGTFIGAAQHENYLGYWLTALGIGERLGFNAALRTASTKAGAVLDWIIAQHRKRVVGRINSAPQVNGGYNESFFIFLWKQATILSAGGTVASLPQNFAAVATANGNAPSWDKFVYNSVTGDRNGAGQEMLIGAPSTLRVHLNQSGADLTTAETTVNGWRSQKKTQQDALGANGAGTTWFQYLLAVFNPVVS